MPSPGAVRLEIIANLRIGRNANIFVEDGAPQLGATSNVAVVHHNATFDQGTGVHTNTASENGLAHHATGENASSRDDAVERFTATSVFIENKFCWWVRIARTSHRRLAIVEI